jgi:hypothetical protein
MQGNWTINPHAPKQDGVITYDSYGSRIFAGFSMIGQIQGVGSKWDAYPIAGQPAYGLNSLERAVTYVARNYAKGGQ